MDAASALGRRDALEPVPARLLLPRLQGSAEAQDELAVFAQRLLGLSAKQVRAALVGAGENVDEKLRILAALGGSDLKVDLFHGLTVAFCG